MLSKRHHRSHPGAAVLRHPLHLEQQIASLALDCGRGDGVLIAAGR
jgi:hypothetical protein